jgi:MFS family permease
MLQLFKNRDFGDYISDTFGFFRHTGKHFMKIFFTINGIPLMIMMVLTYFLFQVYFDFFKSSLSGQDFTGYENMMTENVPLIIILAIFIFLFLIFMSMLSYTIPIIYLDLYHKNKGNNFGVSDVISVLKSNFGRMILFFIASLFVITPILFIVFGLLVLMIFIIIGIPLLMFAIPTFFSWITLSYYEYINYKKGYFEALSDGFYKMKSQYFPIVGSLMVIYIIIQVTMTVFSMIPYFIGLASLFTSQQENPGSTDGLSTLMIMMTIIMVITVLMSYILNNLMLINQGLAHYSRRENEENITAQDSIDLIGRE